MIELELNENQVAFVYNLLDSQLKQDGLKALVSVVDLYNTLLAAQKQQPKKKVKRRLK